MSLILVRYQPKIGREKVIPKKLGPDSAVSRVAAVKQAAPITSKDFCHLTGTWQKSFEVIGGVCFAAATLLTVRSGPYTAKMAACMMFVRVVRWCRGGNSRILLTVPSNIRSYVSRRKSKAFLVGLIRQLVPYVVAKMEIGVGRLRQKCHSSLYVCMLVQNSMLGAYLQPICPGAHSHNGK